MSNKTIEAAAGAVLENFHAPDQSHPSWHLNPETVAKAALLAALPALGEGLAEAIAESQNVPFVGRRQERIAAAVIEHLRSKIEEGEESA